MHIAIEARPAAVVLALQGHFDGASVPEFERVIGAQAASGRRLILDLNDLEFISSAGLCGILTAARKLGDHDTSLALCRLRGEVQKVFDISGFAALLPIFPTVAAAERQRTGNPFET